MALPPPTSPAPTSPPVAAPPSGRSAGWILPAVIALLVGAGAGVLIGAVAFGGDDGGPVELADGAADAAAGCQLLAGLPGEIPDRPGDDWNVDGPNTWRLQGVSAAFNAAAAASRTYRAPGEDAELLRRAYLRFSIEEANEALGNLADWCADHDPAAG